MRHVFYIPHERLPLPRMNKQRAKSEATAGGAAAAVAPVSAQREEAGGEDRGARAVEAVKVAAGARRAGAGDGAEVASTSPAAASVPASGEQRKRLEQRGGDRGGGSGKEGGKP